jgi:hypothetical protein
VDSQHDPNDKTVWGGNKNQTKNWLGQYAVHDSFENTGTYAAQNIVCKDMIDLAKFDISSLIPTSSSILLLLKNTLTIKLNLFSKSINLPFDDANNAVMLLLKLKHFQL